MAAISLANRVAEELGEDIGCSIGYKTWYQKTEAHTSVTYVTDGYLLSTYEKSKTKKVVIVDEAHEFNLNIETLLGLYKKELTTNPGLKLVVMSATIDAEKISRFFGGAPIISVLGKLYPIDRIWEPSMRVEDCVFKYFSPGTNMLVFLSGKEEISRAHEALKYYFSITPSKGAPRVFQLHGEMHYEEQKVVFDHYEEGKIVLATNVAQTSITVPDIDFVIDTGTAKEMQSHDGISSLTEVDISQADCNQRAGRAGRCKPGTYVLCSSTKFQHRKYFSTPEIQRISLENLVLKLATMGLNPLDIEFVHNPDRRNLEIAHKLLVKLGALNKDGSITRIGREMECMPVSARIARMLIEARKYSPEVQGDVAIIAAIFECGDFRGKNFWNNMGYSEECCKSDLTYQLHLFKMINAEWHSSSPEDRKDFYRNRNIKFKVFQNILKSSKDLADKLSLKYMLFEETLDEDFVKIRKCIITSYPDSVYLFYENYHGLSYVDPASGSIRKLDRQSIFSNTWWSRGPAILLAQPLDIEAKNSIYGHHTVALLKNATVVDPDDDLIMDSLLEMATLSYLYDSYTGCLYLTWKLCGVEILRQVSPESPIVLPKTDTFGFEYWAVYLNGQEVDRFYH